MKGQRYRIFLFPWKSLSLTHSLNFEQFCFFLFSDLREKKNICFFFSSEKFVSHSLATKADDPKNRSEKVKKRYLEVFFIFSRKILKTVCFFFFPGKVYTSLTHSFSKGGKKKQHGEKKKTPFLLTHSIFAKKWTKINFSREIKKYDTFDQTKHFYFQPRSKLQLLQSA